MHPIERLRAVARARGVEQSLLATEAAAVLGSLAFDPMGLLTSCRRLIDRHPSAGALWWACARLLAADDARAEARTIALELDDDPSGIDLGLELPEGARIAVIPDLAGGSELAYDLAGMRDDLDVVEVDDPTGIWWDEPPQDADDPPPGAHDAPPDVDDAAEAPPDVDDADEAAEVPAEPLEGSAPPRILVVETGAAGPDRFLTVAGARGAFRRARDGGIALWLVVGVGRRLPGPLFDSLVARAATGDVLPVAGVDRVVEPRRVPCPCPPELLHSPSGWRAT
ncbi:MAG: hypothetical protein ACRDZN_04490 [Acidimicrobiales bacterium]